MTGFFVFTPRFLQRPNHSVCNHNAKISRSQQHCPSRLSSIHFIHRTASLKSISRAGFGDIKVYHTSLLLSVRLSQSAIHTFLPLHTSIVCISSLKPLRITLAEYLAVRSHSFGRHYISWRKSRSTLESMVGGVDHSYRQIAKSYSGGKLLVLCPK